MKHVKRKFESGFTLIEVIIGAAIFSLVVIGFSFMQADIFIFNRMVSDSLLTQDQARTALKNITSEIRAASLSNLGAYPIANASNFSFTFYSNIDNDSLKEQVRYFLDGNTLKKGVIKPSGSPLTYNPADEIITVAIDYVTNGATPIFSYHDSDYDGTTQPLSSPINLSAVRLIKITIIADKNAQEYPEPITLTTQVSIRNLKDNL